MVAVGPIPGKGGWTWIECGGDYAGTAANTRITASIDSAEDAIGTNNSLSAVFDFTPVVDFTVSDIWVNGPRWSPNTAYLSLDNTLQAEIVNVGCNAADGTVQFFVDGVAVGLSAAVPLLNGGASATVSATFDFVGYTAGTNYQLAATVSTAPADSLPGNNTRLEQLTLSPQLPDYEVTSADIDFSVDPGHPARNEKFVISAEISNVGLAAGTDFQVAFYEEGQILIGEVQTFSLSPGIAPGGSLTVNPRDAHGDIVEWGHGFSGNHAILVTVAPLAGIQDDPNDGNNSATRKVWVNFPPQAQVAVSSPFRNLRRCPRSNRPGLVQGRPSRAP